MGVQKLTSTTVSSGKQKVLLNSFFLNSLPNDDCNKKSEFTYSCSNCNKTTKTEDKNEEPPFTEFESKFLCDSCLHSSISAHYRSKFLAQDYTSLNNYDIESRRHQQQPPPPLPSKQKETTLKETKHYSKTLDCLSLTPLDSQMKEMTEKDRNSCSNLLDSIRPKSCSDSIMEVDNLEISSANTELTSIGDQLNGSFYCKKCDRRVNVNEMMTKHERTLSSSSCPPIDELQQHTPNYSPHFSPSHNHNCYVDYLKMKLKHTHNWVESFKKQYKQQVSTFLHRENNLINSLVTLQTELLKEKQKHKLTMEKLERQNEALLSKMALQQKTFQKVRFDDIRRSSGEVCSTSRFHVILHRDLNGNSLGFNVAGGVITKPTEDGEGDSEGVLSGADRLNKLKGLLVTKVSPNSPADRAQIQSGDIIVSVNGISLERLEHNECIDVIKKCKINCALRIEIERRSSNHSNAMVTASTQTNPADILFNHSTMSHNFKNCDLISLSSSITDLESVAGSFINGTDHDSIDYVLSKYSYTNDNNNNGPHCDDEDGDDDSRHNSSDDDVDNDNEDLVEEVVLFKRNNCDILEAIQVEQNPSDGLCYIREVKMHLVELGNKVRNNSTLPPQPGDQIMKVNGIKMDCNSASSFEQVLSGHNTVARVSLLLKRQRNQSYRGGQQQQPQPFQRRSNNEKTEIGHKQCSADSIYVNSIKISSQLSCDTTTNTRMGSPFPHHNSLLDPTNKAAPVNENESPKQSTDSEHFVDDSVFVPPMMTRERDEGGSNRKGCSLGDTSAHVNSALDQSKLKVQTEHYESKNQNRDSRRKVALINSEKQPRDSSLTKSGAQNNSKKIIRAPPSHNLPPQIYHRITESKSQNNFDKLPRVSDKTSNAPFNTRSLTLAPPKYLKRRKDMSTQSKNPESCLDEFNDHGNVNKHKTTSNEQRRKSRQQRSRSIGSQNIYVQIDDVITSDDELIAQESSLVNQSSTAKYSSRHERKSQLTNNDSSSKNMRGGIGGGYTESRGGGNKHHKSGKPHLVPQLEPVNEEKVLTLSKRQQSRLKARMIDGFATVTQLMTHGVASNPLVSVTTL